MDSILERILQAVIVLVLLLGIIAYVYVLIHKDSQGKMLLSSLLWGMIGVAVGPIFVPGSGFTANSMGRGAWWG